MSATGYEYLGGPRDGARVDTLDEADLDDVNGAYAVSGATITDRIDEVTRHVLQWAPGENGPRNAPTCAEPCSRGCPTNGLAS